MRLPFAVAAVVASVGLTGLIVAGVSRGPASPAGPAADLAVAAHDLQPQRLMDAGRLARGLAAMPRAVSTGRDPFTFGDGRRRDPTGAMPPAGPATDLEQLDAPQTRPRPTLQLLGIAEDAAEDGGFVRTAVLSGLNQVFLVKRGEQVAFRFLVREIGADAVEIEDLTDQSVVRLTLR